MSKANSEAKKAFLTKNRTANFPHKARTMSGIEPFKTIRNGT